MPSQLAIGVNLDGLSPGNLSGSVSVTSVGLLGSPAVVNVSLQLNPSSSGQSSFYVSPSGSAGGDGSLQNPWDLATALSHPSAVKPGDTIWLRGGLYSGKFVSSLTGTIEQPIYVRQNPGERATIDSGSSGGAALMINGSDTWFWGFEIMSSNPNRNNPSPGSVILDRAAGVVTLGPRTKLINLVVHDTAEGVDWWTPSVDSELYGSLIYYNGWTAPDRPHGHGVYSQNLDGVKNMEDNIVHSQFGMGAHIYGSSNAYVKHYRMRGKVPARTGRTIW
jgi:hypothetical protein